MSGSSPRVRGELLRYPRQTIPLRIIPACAGRTCTSMVRKSSSADHPRVCGANLSGGAHALHDAGSSPRVRGELRRRCPSSAKPRIIPACAGRTRGTTSTWVPCSDHPRVCGANSNVMPVNGLATGSSPRVRGELIQKALSRQVLRIIPACAGRTIRETVCSCAPTDHPRVCGANSCEFFNASCSSGSSPRVRGERRIVRKTCLSPRIIPACAGRTVLAWLSSCVTPDHPRVCGANVHVDTHVAGTKGSSPRVRGEPGP